MSERGCMWTISEERFLVEIAKIRILEIHSYNFCFVLMIM